MDFGGADDDRREYQVAGKEQLDRVFRQEGRKVLMRQN